MKKNPKFYIWGRATHVGQCYEGLCATTIASFIEQLMKEKGAVPVELCDLKPEYNVQTPSDAYVSLNMNRTVRAHQKMAVRKKLMRICLKKLRHRRAKRCWICLTQGVRSIADCVI